jgi:outer membrane protein assembly factor BamE
MRFRWFLLLALLPLAGCGAIYKLDVQQGNLFDQATVDTLKPGMTKRQVLLVMGSPSIVSPFNQDRWDYISTMRVGRGEMETRDLILHFEGDALARIEGDYFPEDPKKLIREAQKYKRQYPDSERPDEKRRGQG